MAAARHGVAGVQGEVDDDLLDLAGIGVDVGGGGRAARDLDVLADQPAQQLGGLLDHRAEREDLGLQHLLAAESQQLAGERGRPLGRPGDLLEAVLAPRVAGQLLAEHLAGAGDHPQAGC